MSTKNNPNGLDNCYDRADPDEELFTLLGRDRHGSALVHLWALMREKEGEELTVVAEARGCAERMAAEAQRRGKSVLTLDTLLSLAASMKAGSELPESATTGNVSDPPKEGDLVVASRGLAGRLVRVFTKDDPNQPQFKLKGLCNIAYPRQPNHTTVRYDVLRRALPEEAVVYRAAGGE